MNIHEQLQDALDQVSDETGELELDGHILKYEGWSPVCIPTHYKSTQAMINYGIRQSSKIHKEWDKEMHKRGYKALYHEHDEHRGLYGVTYALYRRAK